LSIHLFLGLKFLDDPVFFLQVREQTDDETRQREGNQQVQHQNKDMTGFHGFPNRLGKEQLSKIGVKTKVPYVCFISGNEPK
jgi:hypothetical protein